MSAGPHGIARAARLIGVLLAGLILPAAALLCGALLLNRVPLSAPPGIGERLRIYLTTHRAATASDSVFPELRPRTYPVDAEVLHHLVVEACLVLGYEIVSIDRANHRARAVVRTPLLRFRDDLEARAVAHGGHAALLELRSASRVGKGDLGANTRHLLDVEAIVARLLDHQ